MFWSLFVLSQSYCAKALSLQLRENDGNRPFGRSYMHCFRAEEDDREEIRDWVLTICMDKSVDQQLPTKEMALGTMYAGLYATDLPTCVVTGCPVQKWELLQVNNSLANKADWNKFVRKVKKCPWTNIDQGPLY